MSDIWCKSSNEWLFYTFSVSCTPTYLTHVWPWRVYGYHDFQSCHSYIHCKKDDINMICNTKPLYVPYCDEMWEELPVLDAESAPQTQSVVLSSTSPTRWPRTYNIVFDCVTVSVLHYAAFNAPVDDLCTRPGSEWAAAVGEDRTVNRDYCNWHRGIFSMPSNTMLVFVVVLYQLTFNKAVNEKPVWPK